MDKCAVSNLKRGRPEEVSEDVELGNGNIISHHEDDETHKYFGMKQKRTLETTQIKNALTINYKKLRNIRRSKLSGKNKFSATKTLAVQIATYSFGEINW